VSKPYLEYLCDHILGPSFDPWEFAVGEIFFDYNLARRALRKGARLAQSQHDSAAAERYSATADGLEQALAAFKDPAEGYALAGRNYVQPFLATISHLDIDVVGSVLTAYDVADPFLNVDDPCIEQTMKALERVCAERWPVNVAWHQSGHAGMGMGRFPEDANDGIGSTGGNPWSFATLWAAQYYLRLLQRRDFLGMRDAEGDERAAFLKRADGFLQFVLSHVSPESLTEQIDGQTGMPRGARKLAWAQAALIQTLLVRQEVISGWPQYGALVDRKKA
jgi:GH15 family glucan-1,4-alpha-glucosidase